MKGKILFTAVRTEISEECDGGGGDKKHDKNERREIGNRSLKSSLSLASHGIYLVQHTPS